MATRVLVIDYEIGNILSVCRALEFCGAEILLSGNPDLVRSADRIVLPGVGAFADCIAALRQRQLDTAIIDFVTLGKPLLGICVGMQMLFEGSEEFGWHDGLGIIPGSVCAIPRHDLAQNPVRVPHIGWSALQKAQETTDWSNSILSAVAPGTSAYFVHSFAGYPTNTENVLATCNYADMKITAAVRKGCVFGTQFHPEKSGPQGLAIMKAFLDI
jgi:glutamine amidotransferase